MLGCWSELECTFCTYIQLITPPLSSLAKGQLFFIRFYANLDHIRFIFACFSKILKHHLFASYSLQNICTDSHTNIGFDAKTYILHGIFISEQIFAIVTYWQIFTSKYLFISEYSQNFRRISYSSKYLLKNICIPANIHLQLFAQKRIFATYCLKLYLGKPFTSLRLQL